MKKIVKWAGLDWDVNSHKYVTTMGGHLSFLMGEIRKRDALIWQLREENKQLKKAPDSAFDCSIGTLQNVLDRWEEGPILRLELCKAIAYLSRRMQELYERTWNKEEVQRYTDEKSS